MPVPESKTDTHWYEIYDVHHLVKREKERIKTKYETIWATVNFHPGDFLLTKHCVLSFCFLMH